MEDSGPHFCPTCAISTAVLVSIDLISSPGDLPVRALSSKSHEPGDLQEKGNHCQRLDNP